VDDCTSQGQAQHLTLATKPRSLNIPKMTQGGACMMQGIYLSHPFLEIS